MVRSKLWKGGLLTPTQRHIRAQSTEELACELVNLTRRKQKAKARLKLLLKHSVGLLADALYELGKVEEAEKQRRRQSDLKAASVDTGSSSP